MSRFNSFLYDLIVSHRYSIISSSCIAKFKLSARYKEDVAPFGFDWVRTGDSTDNVEVDIPYEEIVGNYYEDESKKSKCAKGGKGKYFSPSQHMYKRLYKSYQPGNVVLFPSPTGKIEPYHVPVISIYPYDAAVNPHVTAYLTLETEISEDIKEIHLEFDKTYLQIEGADTLHTEQGKYTYEIGIKSIKELKKDHYIQVIATDNKGKRKKAGMLRVWKNAEKHRYSLHILLVNVKFVTSRSFNATVTQGDTTRAEEYIKRFLQHAFITPRFDTMDLDLKFDNEIINRLRHNQGIGYLLCYKTSKGENGKKNLDKTFPHIVTYLQDKLKALKDITKYRVIVFCTGVHLYEQADKEIEELNGYCVNNLAILREFYPGATAAHETLHALHLSHSFDRKRSIWQNLATYKIYTTDNVMDYLPTKTRLLINWWKWQWKIARYACMRFPEREETT